MRSVRELLTDKCVSRPQMNDRMFEPSLRGLVFHSDNKKGFTPKADADQGLIDFLTNVAMQAQRVSWRIDVDNGSLGVHHIKKDASHKIGNIRWELRRNLCRIHLIRPVILASESHPTHLFLEDLLHVEFLMDIGILRLEQNIGWGGGEKGIAVIWIGDVMVKVEVGPMFRI